MLIRRIARPLLATVFVVGGIDALRNPQNRASAAAPLVAKGEETLPTEVTSKVPTDPVTLVRINGAVQVAGGTLLALGKAPRLASLALAATVIPTTVTEQDFWNETDPAAKARKRNDFLKNLSLLGGVMIASVDTAGKPSLGWRGRRAAREASEKVQALVGSSGGGASDQLSHGAHVAAEHGAELAEIARERGVELAEVARERGGELVEAAREHAPEVAAAARERGAELVEAAREHAPEVAAAAKERGHELAALARKYGVQIADAARDHGPDVAAAARERTEELAELAEAARKHGPEVAAAARERATALAESARERATHLRS
ncbi:MAG TPA: DoxX family protein [Aldersonia sp.]